MTFKARLTSKTNDQPSTAGVDFNEVDLMPGDVTVAIDYSTVNYKDALAVSGRAPVIRHYPGSHTLANVLAQTRYRWAVAAFGLAQGTDLPASVLPFILRNVTLAGIDSVNAPQRVRLQAWARLATDLDLDKLASATSVVALAEVPRIAGQVLQGEVRGRMVVDVNA